MDTSMWVILVVLAFAIGAALAWFLLQQQRRKKLRTRFGPEYEHTVRATGSPRQAEAELERRQKRIEHLDVRPLDPQERAQYAQRWKTLQAQFVDNPEATVVKADDLLTEVMRARGYPVADFEQRAADLSVDHSQFVQDYRAAYEIAQRRRDGRGSTEDLRQAMVHYRSMFEDLLEEQQQIRLEPKR